MDKPDYYAILGVAKDASPEEIRTAFEQAQAAPGGDENSALAEAYDVLSDPQRRIFYDQQVYVTATVPRRRSGPEAGASAAASKAIRPRDAATLIIVDAASGTPRILMGRRRDDVVFMPGKYVFPGGRVDREDRLVSSADDLAPGEIARLMHDMKGAASEARARAIALAAVRETWEEACSRVEVDELFAVFNLPQINQVYMMFRAHLPVLEFAPGVESLECKLYYEHEIPWAELAFPTITHTLKRFFQDRAQGRFGLHFGDIVRDGHHAEFVPRRPRP